jgi:hypothetical protein
MSDETTAKVWLYEAGDWLLTDDPISWADGDDVMEKYAGAGYSEFGSPAALAADAVTGRSGSRPR